jgi:hypothetical protein
MQYALLIYGRTANLPNPINAAIADVLTRPYVTGWARLYSDESATTVRGDADKTLLTDGPFIDSKEYLAGLIVIDVDNLDGALEVAQELQNAKTGGGIEVRPVFEGQFRGA